MNRIHWIITGIIAAAMVAADCGESKKSEGASNLSELFPEQFKDSNLVRSSDVRSFKGQSLYEYINGGAEIYHQYDFIEAATALYKSGDKEINLDIYRFGSLDNAYGLYSSIKPVGPGNIQLGIEGFSTENSIDFVKGSYVIRVVGFDESETTKNAVRNLAEKINALVPGSTARPETFSLFPSENAVQGSEKILAESFLGQVFLTDVYTMDYGIQGEQLTLFLTDDSTGEKFLKWSGQVKREEADLSGLPFDGQSSFLINNDYYGKIIVGLRAGKLVGIIGYKENHREFLSRWLESMSNPV